MVSVRSSRLTIVVDDGDLGLLGGGSFPNAHWDKSSIGNGNIMVEFFSALIEFSVCKYRSYKRMNRITSFYFYFLHMLLDYLVKYSFLNYHHKLSNSLYVTKNHYRNLISSNTCNALWLSAMVSAASRNALDAFCSPSAAIT